jgi:hypothetical protein
MYRWNNHIEIDIREIGGTNVNHVGQKTAVLLGCSAV